MKKTIYLLLTISLSLGWIFYLNPTLKVATGYTSKYVCSHVFLSNITQNKINEALDFFPINLVQYSIDSENKKIESSFFGFIAKSTSSYYEDSRNCGCILGLNSPNDDTRLIKEKKTLNDIWPRGNEVEDSIPSYIDQVNLDVYLDSILRVHSGIYAVVISHNNKLITEKYQEGINKDTRLLGWSMTKTIANTLFGILDKNKQIDIINPLHIKEWENDERKKITINNLLQMNSGLQWDENYSTLSNVTRMLYLENDLPNYAMKSSPEYAPNKNWYYASGTSNILSSILRAQFKNQEDYISFPHDSLFQRINMNSAIIESDMKGNYILSSYAWATARDWTKFGLLYLNKGNWFGDQIFTSNWVDYSTKPAPNSKGIYGSHLWLNNSGEKLPSVPRDAYYESGYGGQKILIIPSKNMVITLMSGRVKGFDFDSFYKNTFEYFEITAN